MKLIIPHCKNCRAPILLSLKANNRGSMRMLLHGDYFRVQCGTCTQQDIYSVNDVIAQEDSNETATGALVGGLVGLLGGPLGVFIGGGIGAMIGNGSDTEERNRVKNFNESW